MTKGIPTDNKPVGKQVSLVSNLLANVTGNPKFTSSLKQEYRLIKAGFILPPNLRGSTILSGEVPNSTIAFNTVPARNRGSIEQYLLPTSGLMREILAVDSSPESVWTWSSSDSQRYQTSQKKKIVAWALYNMTLYVKQHKASTVAENKSRTQDEQKKFLQRHTPTKSGLLLSFPETMDDFPYPELGPLTEKGEIDLEMYNRCWELLRISPVDFTRTTSWFRMMQ